MHSNWTDLPPLISGKTPEETMVVVAMSGGVDSSVTAAMLHKLGYNTVGVTLQLWDYTPASEAAGEAGISEKKFGTCCALDDVYDAKRVCQTLGIPHYTLNMENAFKDAVINDFVETYLNGATPIPCVRCNQRIKFKELLDKAKSLGADALVTGHYVQKETNDAGRAVLKMAEDAQKDQTYYLFTTTQEQLDFLDFPLGKLTKDVTRQLAKELGLHVHSKPDSQDICFVPGGDYRTVVKKFAPEAAQPGNIVTEDGKIVGEHNGIVGYTVGQRKGLGGGFKDPMYVVAVRPESHEVVIGLEESLYQTAFTVKELNWLPLENPEGQEVNVKVRAQHDPVPARLTDLGDGRLKVETTVPTRQISPGQAAVFYDESGVMLGGGWIEMPELITAPEKLRVEIACT